MNQPGEITMYLETPHQVLFEQSALYRKRKIRKDAEEFIVEEAKALDHHTPIKIKLYLPSIEAGLEDRFTQAIHAHFTYCRAKTDRERKRTLQYGWRILLIAFVVLGVALSGSQLLTKLFSHNSLVGTAIESLTILGWVAFWKPVELLLYAWYPFSRDRSLYTRLTQSEVQLIGLEEGAPGRGERATRR